MKEAQANNIGYLNGDEPEKEKQEEKPKTTKKTTSKKTTGTKKNYIRNEEKYKK